MTEDEAKTKWCPFIQVTWQGGLLATNRDGFIIDIDEDGKCIASECMAWRWALTEKELKELREEFPDGSFDNDCADGYCGLAK